MWRWVNIARLVLPAIEFDLGPLIVNMRDSALSISPSELRRNEIEPAAISEHDITRHYVASPIFTGTLTPVTMVV